MLIVGAGPAGLTLAIELARRDIPFRIIDKAAARPKTSRAIGTQARTVEVFQLLGIPETALEPAARPCALRLAERDRTLARFPFGERVLGATPRLISMDESDTERVLEERLAQLGGRVERGVELIDYRVDGDGVIATLDGPDGTAEVRARFLIGADGDESTVRRVAAIGFAGSAYPERFLLADLDLDWAFSHDEGHIWIGDEGLVAVIPLPGERRYRVIVPLAPGAAMPEGATEAEIATQAEDLLRERTGVPLRRIGEPHWASTFRIQRRQAERYRQGPVFLAGDAAHVHSPIGGQGMNLGIQDAFNLGWKLALAVRGEAAPGLLDSYETERHPIGSGVLRGTNVATRLALLRHPVARTLREWLLPAAIQLHPVRHRTLEAVSQLGINYRGSPLAVDADRREESRGPWRRGAAGLHAGDRAPDLALFAAQNEEPVSLFDLIARGWTMLMFPGVSATPDTITALDAVARQVRETVDGAVSAYLVLDGPPEREPATPALIDPTGEAGRTFGAGEGLVALVRPDGYLGYRGHPDQPGELASYLARVFAMRMAAA